MQSDRETIMVVDDIPGNLNLLRDMLSAKGYRVLTFPEGQLALNAAARIAPDLILLDIDMPLMNGFEVCARLKADPMLTDIPIIFLSGMSDLDYKVKAFEIGGMDYVTKPFQSAEVISRVRTHLRLRKLQSALMDQNMLLEELVEKKVQEISESQQATIYALLKMSESRDDDTGSHIERTQNYCRVLSEKLHETSAFSPFLDEVCIENLYHASPLHDIGKVAIPDNILLKPGRLTEEEFALMKTHVALGEKTLQSVQSKYPLNHFINIGIVIVRYHHEKWDGSGYPNGLFGDSIPLPARIMAIADVYDALRSKRPYKEAFSHQDSVEIILKGAGTHFDPCVVAAFLASETDFERTHKELCG